MESIETFNYTLRIIRIMSTDLTGKMNEIYENPGIKKIKADCSTFFLAYPVVEQFFKNETLPKKQPNMVSKYFHSLPVSQLSSMS